VADLGGARRPPRRARHRGLLKIYAHCIDGQVDAANQRITDALSTREAEQASVTKAGTRPRTTRQWLG
jgi:hypothetical protein